MNDIHTCSYSCERPACIKAQRDALAASQATITATPSRVTVRVEGVGAATLEVIDGGVDLPLDTVVSMARSAGTSEPTGTDEYLAYLEAAVDEAGFVIKHDGGTLGNSNFRLEPKTQPAAAQESVGEVSEWEGSLCVQWVPNYEPPVGTKLYAAPVTAAPGIDLARFRAPVLNWIEQNKKIEHLSDVAAWAVGEGAKLLAMIDASRKGDD